MLRKQSIRKLIEDNFHANDQFDEETEENIVFSGKKLTDAKNVAGFGGLSNLKCKVLPVDGSICTKTYGGKVVSRKRINDEKLISNSSDESGDNDSGAIENTSSYDEEDDSSGDDRIDSNEEQEEDDDEYDLSNYLTSNAEDKVIDDNESEIEDDTSAVEECDGIAVLSSKHIDEASDDVKKGASVCNQLNLYHKLLEGRMKLQKCLTLSNRLPNYKRFDEYKSVDNVSVLSELHENVTDLLENLLNLQTVVRKNSEEFDKIKKDDKLADDNDEAEMVAKKRKVTDYSGLLQKKFDGYIQYRNSVIQKWNDKTKVSTGKLAKSNFSAFDRPTLAQIEYILKDKDRLIKRTRLKRSQYNIIGNDKNTDDKQSQDDTSERNTNQDVEYDTEIFDDDDFYHKLLRDYIERKTTDVTDPVQLSKKWMELQKLRIKMKHKVDTRSTKGRKLRYNVHPKLVNFMVPVVDNMWNETAITDLYNSLFGKSLK